MGAIVRNRCEAIAAALLAAIGFVGCNKVVKNTSDQSPPKIEIKVKGTDGQYAAATSADLSASSAGQLDWMCIVSDASGVKSSSITYSSSLDGCTIQSAVWDCVASYLPKPQNLSQTLQGDANGQVLDKLPLLATVTGPFTCECPGQGSGRPYGRTIKATCTGQNWSSDPAKASAQKVLTINLK